MPPYFKKFIEEDFLYILLISSIVIAVFSPLLFGGKMFYDEEQIGFYYPQSYFFQKELKTDSPILWNSSYYGGVSVDFDQFVSTHYPINRFLFTNFDFFDAHHLSIVFAVLVMSLFSYWLGRTAGFLPGSSVFLACGYLLAVTFGWLDIGTLAAHAFLIYPVLALAILKIEQGRSFLLYSVIGGLGLAAGFLAGFMQIIFYIYSIIFLFALYLDWRREAVFGWNRFLCTRGLAMMSLIAILLGWPQILPSVFLIKSTIRSASYAAQHAYFPGFDEFITFILPDYIQIPFFGGGSAGMYIGALGFFSALFGVLHFREKLSKFFLGAYLIVLGLAFHLPIFSWLNEHIPPFSNFGGQFRWMVAGTLPIAFLGASGFDSLVRRGISSDNNRFIKILGYFIGLFIIGLSIFNLALKILLENDQIKEGFINLYFNWRVMNFPISHYMNVLDVALRRMSETISFGDWRFSVPLLSILIAYFLIKNFLKKEISEKKFYISGVAFTILNTLFIFFAQYENALVDQKFINDMPVIAKEISARESDPNSYRLASFLVGDAFFWDVSSKRKLSPEEITRTSLEFLTNNSNIFYDIQRIDGMEPYRTLRHNQLINTVLFPPDQRIFDESIFNGGDMKLDQLHNDSALKKVSLGDKVDDFLNHLPMLSMLNVKYVNSLIPIFDHRLNLLYSGKLFDFPVSVYLYENKDVLPRIYFADNVSFISGSDEEVLSNLIKIKDFRKNSIIECDGCDAQSSDAGGDIEIKSYLNGFIDLRVGLRSGGWLIFGESFMPGWVGILDGKEVPIYRANHIFQAIYVPAGIHSVIFEYKDITSLKWGELMNWLREKI